MAEGEQVHQGEWTTATTDRVHAGSSLLRHLHFQQRRPRRPTGIGFGHEQKSYHSGKSFHFSKSITSDATYVIVTYVSSVP